MKKLRALRPADIAKDLLYILIGSATVAFGLSIFTIPNDIAPGGISGLATAFAYITPIRVSIWELILNLPLLLTAWRALGTRSLLCTLAATVMLSVFIDLWTKVLPGYTNNDLLASFFGGVLTGLGVGILFLRGISTGGTDLLALILKKIFPNIPNGTMLLLLDAAVVIVAVCIFRDIEVALYSAICIFVSSKVIDALSQGVDYAKVIYCITDHSEDVNRALTEQTERGVTLIPAVGGYTGNGKQIVMTITRRSVLSQTLRIIKRADPHAFTFIVDSTEVHGEGFKEEALPEEK